VLDFFVSIGVITVLFAAIYKFLPDAKIKWRDVWIGALVTSVLFTIAKFLLGLYFGNSDPASAYGAAGTIILIMLWVSYAGMILLFGAEFTQVYATKHGRKIIPTDVAESTGGKDDNGAIVNKKPEAKSKARAREKTREADRTRSGKDEKRKDEKKLSFSQLMLYLVASKIRKVFT
jgi:membrane protein